MNVIFFIISVAALIMLIITDPESILSVMIEGAEGAVVLCVKLLAIYCVWLSVLRIMEDSGLSRKINRLFSPITKRLFKGEDEKTQEYITLNMTANLLGMGSCATPAGIKAIESMNSKKSPVATDNMILLVVINCTSIQLIPATIIGMRASAGSLSPSDIILPALISTIASTAIGIICCKILGSMKKKDKKIKESEKPKTFKPKFLARKQACQLGIETKDLVAFCDGTL